MPSINSLGTAGTAAAAASGGGAMLPKPAAYSNEPASSGANFADLLNRQLAQQPDQALNQGIAAASPKPEQTAAASTAAGPHSAAGAGGAASSPQTEPSTQTPVPNKAAHSADPPQSSSAAGARNQTASSQGKNDAPITAPPSGAPAAGARNQTASSQGKDDAPITAPSGAPAVGATLASTTISTQTTPIPTSGSDAMSAGGAAQSATSSAQTKRSAVRTDQANQAVIGAAGLGNPALSGNLAVMLNAVPHLQVGGPVGAPHSDIGSPPGARSLASALTSAQSYAGAASAATAAGGGVSPASGVWGDASTSGTGVNGPATFAESLQTLLAVTGSPTSGVTAQSLGSAELGYASVADKSGGTGDVASNPAFNLVGVQGPEGATQAQQQQLANQAHAVTLTQAGLVATTGSNLNLHTPLGDGRWGQELGQKITWMTGSGMQSAELVLNPPDLGPLKVVLQVSGNQASAMFTSAHAAVCDAVQQSLPQLREMMAGSGINLGNAMVGGQNSSPGGQGFSQSRPSGAAGDSLAATGVSSSDSQASPVTRTVVTQGLLDTFA